MLLVIDIGNTNGVFAVFDGEVLKGKWRMSTNPQRTADEYAVLIQQFFVASGLQSPSIDGAILSTVVPESQFAVTEFCRMEYDVEPLVVGDASVKLGIEVRVDELQEVGADRLVNAVEAWRRYQQPMVVVDFGTATTFDVIGDDGAYLGGVIAPGVNLSLNALHMAAAKLPNVRIRPPAKVIGTSTVGAMESGVYYGYIGLIEGIVAQIRKEYGAEMKVIATGGLAKLYGKACASIEDIVDDLTIVGLKTIYHYNHCNQ